MYPFVSTDGKVILIYNGEIYNYPDLKKELENKGKSFKTNCDAETILVGYEVWGTDVFNHLRGMFSIAIWDGNSRKLILARDRFGIKPLYYLNSRNFFLFGSEAKSIYLPNLLNLNFKLDPERLNNLLGFMFLPDSENTLIEDIKKVSPGTYVEITENTIKKHKYYDLEINYDFRNLSYEDAKRLVEEKLIESIRIHLMSDVPLAISLSGGVDSGLITAILIKRLGVNLSTITAKFEHKFNESSLAAETASILGSDHIEIPIDVNEINNNIEDYVRMFDDLSTFDGGLITSAILGQHLKKNNFKVLLLGEGADEVFGGYSWFGLAKPPFSYLPEILRNQVYYYALSRNLTYKPGYYGRLWQSFRFKEGNIFDDISYREITTQLPNHLLMKVDKGSMQSSIESRVPYLDHELVELVFSIKQEFKDNGIEKRILRDIARKYLPEEIAMRKKKGFFLPMNDVLTANKKRVVDYVLDRNSLSRRILGEKFAYDLFRPSSLELLNMQKEYFKWRLFLLEAWSKAYNLRNL
jgi:asparagine synthase (glutamine-hydrolysing)